MKSRYRSSRSRRSRSRSPSKMYSSRPEIRYPIKSRVDYRNRFQRYHHSFNYQSFRTRSPVYKRSRSRSRSNERSKYKPGHNVYVPPHRRSNSRSTSPSKNISSDKDENFRTDEQFKSSDSSSEDEEKTKNSTMTLDELEKYLADEKLKKKEEMIERNKAFLKPIPD